LIKENKMSIENSQKAIDEEKQKQAEELERQRMQELEVLEAERLENERKITEQNQSES